jgi:hypothetical protein
MLFPKYALDDLLVGSGSIIGKGNIEQFFNHVSMHKDVVGGMTPGRVKRLERYDESG